MKRVETATKPQLASLTELSVVTVNSLVKELQNLGEIFEDETVRRYDDRLYTVASNGTCSI